MAVPAKKTRQYTLRNVPASVDRSLRRLAKSRGRSLNGLLLDIVRDAAGMTAEPAEHHDLDHLIGTWVSDPETERALDEQRSVVPGDWP
jgi:hypothetical protein